MHTIADKKLLMLRPSEIVPSTNQPRRVFDEDDLKLLADSIAVSGIIQPLVVRKNSAGRYELIAGERRLRAAKMVGMRRVPCVLHKTDDATAAFYTVLENLQRTDLNMFEEAWGIHRLVFEHGLSQAEVSVRLGIAQSTLSNKLRLLRLDPASQDRIIEAHLTERHARALLRVPESRRNEVLDRIITQELNLQQTEALIAELLNMNRPENATSAQQDVPVRKMAIGDVRLFANSLSKLIDTMQSAGIEAQAKKLETDKYIEYKVKIPKDNLDVSRFKQLKIC